MQKGKANNTRQKIKNKSQNQFVGMGEAILVLINNLKFLKVISMVTTSCDSHRE